MTEIELLQEILDNGGRLIFEKTEDCVQVALEATLNNKDYYLKVKVDTIGDFLQKDPLNAMVTSIRRAG